MGEACSRSETRTTVWVSLLLLSEFNSEATQDLNPRLPLAVQRDSLTECVIVRAGRIDFASSHLSKVPTALDEPSESVA